ncbi:flavodoxin family protein [Holospora curviuscula]|uniref:NADPH-dependent FMN reductase n=1 Tax=Holospora curviuscula TaxID=1082868 RepID=A0A2S5R8Y4_9PROT|nr:NAD(P)H-dependent oxidoreductase [Holospora curviuscula]PPE03760.1 NADPH-dependent FMN reductase [Holospora curviuscula]
MSIQSYCIALNGSSRPHGNTKALLNKISKTLGEPYVSGMPIVDLCTLNITPYDYEGRNQKDDFIPLMERCIGEYSTIVIATPIYWYTVSAYVKIFLDRITDLMTIRRDLKKALEGTKISVIANFAGRNADVIKMVEGHINDLFSHLCDYLKMQYIGSYFIHMSVEQVDEKALRPLFS